MALDFAKGIATQVGSQVLRKVAGNIGGLIRGGVKDESETKPESKLDSTTSKYQTNNYTFPLDVDSEDPGIGNHGHYIVFFINQQEGAEIGFGEKSKSGRRSVLEDGGNRNIPEFIKKLNLDGTSTKEKNTTGTSDQQHQDLGEKHDYFADRPDLVNNNGGSTPKPTGSVTSAGGSSGTTGLYLTRNPTVRLDTCITLYMPASVSVAYSADYGEQQIGVGAAVVGDAYNTLKDNLSLEGVKQVLDNNKNRAGEGLKEGAINAFLATADTVGSPFGMTGIRGAVEASQGIIVSDRMELLFKGIGRRSFSYTFSMLPRNKEEADEIRKIVFAFKSNMSPEFVDGQRSGRKLRVPNTFDIEYMYLGAANDYLNKISTCVLKQMDVKYGGNRYKTFEALDGESPPPVLTEITLSFEEMDLITRDKIHEGY